MTAQARSPKTSRKRKALIAFTLMGVTLAVFSSVYQFDFVNFDDDAHVYQNPHVVGGLTSENLRWAFGIHGPSQWHPLAWISHQLDCQLYQLWPGGHHLTNLLLHAANAVLLFLFLASVTGYTARSAVVAWVFAIHPLNVESVAWVSERRNVLSLFFLLLTLMAYVCYIHRRSIPRYLLVVVLFTCGLMSKPMVVTLPFLMLLLDYWPFRQTTKFQPLPDPSHSMEIPPVPVSRLVLEKIPLLLLAMIASLFTIWCQAEVGTIASQSLLPLRVRFLNALAAYGLYLRKLIWPSDLGVFYPHPGFVSENPESELLLPALLGGAVILGISAWAIKSLRQRPYLAVGWFWYLGTLVPMIGLVQVGQQQLADRYVYLPIIGILIAMTWLVSEAALACKFHRSWVQLLVGSTVGVCTILGWLQTGYWKNSITLFERTLTVTHDNSLAHNNLGLALSHHQAPLDRVVGHYLEALRINPKYALARYNLGVVLQDHGYVREAIPHFQESIELSPDRVDAHLRLGIAYADLGEFHRSLLSFQEGVRLAPQLPEAHLNLGIALSKMKKIEAANQSFRRAVELAPHHIKARYGLAMGLYQLKNFSEAEQQFRQVIKWDPQAALAHNALGEILLKKGDRQNAAFHFREALKIHPHLREAQINLHRCLTNSP